MPNRFKQLLGPPPDAIVGVADDGRIVMANGQAEAVFGWPCNELIGMLVETVISDLRTRPVGVEYKLPARRKDGTEFQAEVSLSSINTDRGVLSMATVRDGSARKRAEREFEQFVQLAPDAIIGVGRDGKIMLSNAQTEALFGWPHDDLVGLPIETLIPDRFRALHPGHRIGYFTDPRTRPSPKVELFGRRRDGSVFPAEIRLSSIDIENGVMAITAIRDISERVDAQRSRQELKDEHARTGRLKEDRERSALEEQLNQLRRSDSVGQLAGGIAHDFNNLLGVILNYTQFVLDEIGEASPAYDDVVEIMRAAERATSLTRQLLIFSRREVVRVQPLDLNRVLADLERLLRRTLGEHIQLDIRPARDLPPAEVDPGQIEQVLVNLAINARDAMPNGGRLTIETSAAVVDADFSEMDDVAPGRYVRIVVSDSGTGMPADVISRAFEPFYTTKAAGLGTGLGLATVYGIITEAGGTVRLYSEIGMGTTVKVLLPVSTKQPAPAAAPAAPPAAAQGETILLVEDEADVRRTAERVLREAGYDVVTAAGGNDALELVRLRGPAIQLLLTDVVLPGINGPELAERLTALLSDLKIVFMSGYFHQMLDELEKLGIPLNLVEKPFTAETLLRSVRTVLDAPRAQDLERTGG